MEQHSINTSIGQKLETQQDDKELDNAVRNSFKTIEITYARTVYASMFSACVN